MIPLNKPGYQCSRGDNDFIGNHFPGCHSLILATAGDGLNLIYRSLHKERGGLRIGVSPFACFQAIYPIVINGHTPVFIDIDKNTLNMDADKLVSRNDLDAVELIHLGGNPNEMDKICQWAQKNDKILIEDCAQALGSSFRGKELGNFGDYAVFSLIKNLHATTGGLIISKNALPTDRLPKISGLLVKYRNLKKYLESHSNHHTYNPWNLAYLMLLKMKEKGAQTASASTHSVENVLEEELRKSMNTIEELNKKRAANASYMMSRVDASKCKIQTVPDGGQSNRNRLLFRIEKPLAEQVIAQLRKAGIAGNNLTQNYLHGFQPHVSKDSLLHYYYKKDELECYDSIFNHVIAIPCSPFLTQEEMDYIVNKLNQITLHS